MTTIAGRHPDLFSTTVTMIRYGGSEHTYSTGFFFKHQGNDYLVTNEHALDIRSVNDEKLKEVRIFTRDSQNEKSSLSHHDVTLFKNGTKTWSSAENIDVAVIPLQSDIVEPNIDLSILENQSEDRVLRTYAFSENNLPNDEYLIGSGTNVAIIGYPIRGEKPYYPYTRVGMISSPFEVDHESDSYFTTDARMHTGTSGSPILLLPNGIYRTRSGFRITGEEGPYLIGVHSAEWRHARGNTASLDLNQGWYIDRVLDIIRGIK